MGLIYVKGRADEFPQEFVGVKSDKFLTQDRLPENRQQRVTASLAEQCPRWGRRREKLQPVFQSKKKLAAASFFWGETQVTSWTTRTGPPP